MPRQIAYHQKGFVDHDNEACSFKKKIEKCINGLTSKSLPSDTSDDELAQIASLISSVTRSKGLNEILSTQMNWICLALILTNVIHHSLIFR